MIVKEFLDNFIFGKSTKTYRVYAGSKGQAGNTNTNIKSEDLKNKIILYINGVLLFILLVTFILFCVKAFIPQMEIPPTLTESYKLIIAYFLGAFANFFKIKKI